MSFLHDILGDSMMITTKFASVLYDKTYDETLQLLTKSEHFLKNYSAERMRHNNDVLDLRVNCEMTRVTSRLTQIMAWLLAQKAALNGEISHEEANTDKFCLNNDPFCLSNTKNGQEDDYPLAMRELLIDSLVLFKRVLALSTQVREGVNPTSSNQTCRTLN